MCLSAPKICFICVVCEFIITGTVKLRKENQLLRNEIADLKAKLQRISENLTKMEEQHGRRPDEREMSPGRVHSVEFVSQQYDMLNKFKVEAERQIRFRFFVTVLRNQLKYQRLTVTNSI